MWPPLWNFSSNPNLSFFFKFQKCATQFSCCFWIPSRWRRAKENIRTIKTRKQNINSSSARSPFFTGAFHSMSVEILNYFFRGPLLWSPSHRHRKFHLRKISLLFSCYSLGELFPLDNLGHLNLLFINSSLLSSLILWGHLGIGLAPALKDFGKKSEKKL